MGLGIVFLLIGISVTFSMFIGYLIGRAMHRGKSENRASELPDKLFTVVFSSDKNIVIETMDKNQDQFFVKKEVIQQPILVGELIRKPHTFWEYKKRNLVSLGYPQLVKCINQW